eukprot:scaffold40167_cov64-Cyclotella_meneghiniana.AAC.1
MRGERLAAPRLASLVTRPDQNARESPLCLQILTIMAMRPLLLNHDPADFGQPRAYATYEPTSTYYSSLKVLNGIKCAGGWPISAVQSLLWTAKVGHFK